MIRRTPCLLVALAFLALAWGSAARAQSPIEFNIHAGGISFDDADDTELVVGALLEKHFENGLSFGGTFAWSQVGEAADVYFYNVQITYTFPTDSKLRPFLGGGAGAATFSFDSETGADIDLASGSALRLASVGHEDRTEAMVPVGGGITFVNDARRPSWGVRGQVRDNIILADESTTHNIEFTGGFSFFF